MLHRFIHIGDLHLDSTNRRNEDRIAALDQIIAEVQAGQPISAWLIPGDLFHQRSTIADRNALKDRLMRMGEFGPTVICYGNHDLPGDLDIFADLATQWPVYVVARPDVLTIQLATGARAAIFVLPYPTRAGLVAAGTPSDQIVEAARAALDVLFIDAAAKLRDAAAYGCVPLAIGHVNVGGSILSSGQPNIGREIEIDPTLIDRLGPIYVGLNHIHRAQKIGGAEYPGSVCRLDWGEVEEKHYLAVDYALEPGGIGHSDTWLYDVTAVPVNIPPMYHIEGLLTRDGFDWHGDDEAEQAGPGFFSGADVRVRFRYNANERAALDFEAVKAPFAGARRLELDPIAERIRASRAPEVAQATSLVDKVKAFVGAAGLSWDGGVETKLALLQMPDGTAFANAIESSLTGAATHSSPHEAPSRQDAAPVEDLSEVLQ